MRYPRKFLCEIMIMTVAIVLFAVCAHAQAPLVRTVSDATQWQNRANRLTEEIVSESSAVPTSERAVYLALLAKIWWLRDQAQAKGYLRRAVDLAITSVDFEDGVEFRKRAEHWRRTLFIVTSFDPTSGRSLAEGLVKELKKKRGLGRANADAYALTALQFVENDTRMAYELGVKSLNYGISQLLHILIMRLSEKDPKLGQELLRLAFNSASGIFRYEFLGDISVSFLGGAEGKLEVDIAQRGYLELIAELLSLTGTEEDREARCEFVPLITPLVDRFNRYVPGRALAVRREIQNCTPAFDPLAPAIAFAQLADDEVDDTYDLLQKAENAGDSVLKTHYYYAAILDLAQEEKFDQILSILDGMTDDKKVMGPTIWNSWRIEYAFRAALKNVRENDMPAAYRILDRTPGNIRPFVRLRLSNELYPGTYREFILENLSNIGKELGSFEIREKIAARGFLALSRLYLSVKPSEADESFAQAVKYINKVDRDNPDGNIGKDYAPFRDYVPLPAEMLQYDENSTYSSLSNVSSRRSRVRLKLGLLESVLKMS